MGIALEQASNNANSNDEPSASGSSTESNTSTSQHGGGKNAQHKNQKAKQSAQEKYEQFKDEYYNLKSTPNKTKADKQAMTKSETQMKHWHKKAQETGENHSQKAKGSN